MHERGNNKGLFSCLLSKLSCAMISLLKKKKNFSYASYAQNYHETASIYVFKMRC